MRSLKLLFISLFFCLVAGQLHAAQTQVSQPETKRNTAHSMSLTSPVHSDQAQRWSKDKTQDQICAAGQTVFQALPEGVQSHIEDFYPIDPRILEQCRTIQIRHHIHESEVAREIESVTLSADGTLLATVMDYEGIALWNLETNICRRISDEQLDSSYISHVILSKDKKRMVIIYKHRDEIGLWNIEPEEPQLIKKIPFAHPMQDAQITPEGNLLYIDGNIAGDRVALYNMDTETEVASFDIERTKIKLHPNGTTGFCITGPNRDHKFSLIERDLKTNHELRTICCVANNLIELQNFFKFGKIYFSNDKIVVYVPGKPKPGRKVIPFGETPYTKYVIDGNQTTKQETSYMVGDKWDESNNGRVSADVLFKNKSQGACTIGIHDDKFPKLLPHARILFNLLQAESQFKQDHILTDKERCALKACPQFVQTAIQQKYPNLYLSKHDYYMRKLKQFWNHPTTQKTVNIAYYLGALGFSHFIIKKYAKKPNSFKETFIPLAINGIVAGLPKLRPYTKTYPAFDKLFGRYLLPSWGIFWGTFFNIGYRR